MKDASHITPYQDSGLGKKTQVTQMFDNISGNYDGMNRIISLGLDKGWRRKVVAKVLKWNPEDLLDIATGTGDLAISFSERKDLKITGLDLSEGMLSVARQKAAAANLSERIAFVQGDSEQLPFEDRSFDAVTVAFGIRNFETLEKGLAEILRVLRPGGILVILETSVPTKFPFKQGYWLYGKFLLPLIGKLFSKDKSAYGYLSESAAAFPHGEKLNNILRKIGFIDVEAEPQTMGVATIYSCFRE